ncbi:MAG TPA: DUF3035 domain-containing protein [Geminicoccaceae bacterium]
MASRSRIGIALGACVLVAGCSGSLGDTLGFGKRSPDEFAVVKRQPLIVPPDYNLRPPDPDARRPLPGQADARARAALTGVPIEERAAAAAPQPGSAGEAALVGRTAEVQADPAVRARIAEETGGAAEVDPALFEELMTGQPQSGAAGAPAAADAPDALAGPSDDAPPGAGPTLIRRDSTPLEDL